jgi:hypothetical protein
MIDARDAAIFNASATAMAALGLTQDLLRYLEAREPEALRRFADLQAEACETVLATNEPEPDAPLGRNALFREVATLKLTVLKDGR